jgi:hypothetical protein
MLSSTFWKVHSTASLMPTNSLRLIWFLKEFDLFFIKIVARDDRLFQAFDLYIRL